MMKILFLIWLLAVSFGLPVCAAGPQWTGADGGSVDLEADELNFEQQTGRYQASGHVQLKRGDLKLQSDHLWWHQESGEIEASGQVRLQSPKESLSGERIRYNLETSLGTVEQGRVFLQDQNLHIAGDRIEKLGEQDYRISRGTFTTCDGEVPSWKFGAEQLDVTLGGYARAKNAVFYLKDLPSFYLPYLIYPAKSDRESGLLIPRVGYSSRRGSQYSGAYYQVLGRNQDATVYLDVLSRLGLGKGLEYRYVFGRSNAGEARAYHIDAREGENRYALEWQHQGELPARIHLKADTEYVSERDYFDDFGEVADEYNKDKSQSDLSLSRNWEKYNLVVQGKYTKDLEVDDPSTLQLLPRVTFDAVRQRLGGSPVYFGLSSEYTNFWREEGLKGQRLTYRPSLSASFMPWNLLEIQPEIGWRDRHYWAANLGPEDEHGDIYDFNTRLSGKVFRIYERSGKRVSKIRHSLEPEITYFYTPDVRQDELPSFDNLDRIAATNRIDYALVQRWTTRTEKADSPPEYRDPIYLRFSQSYYFEHLPVAGNSFSAVRAELRIEPNRRSYLDFDLSYDFEEADWDAYAATAGLSDRNENSISLEYRKQNAASVSDEVDYGALNLRLGWLRPVYLGYQQRYDFLKQESLEKRLDVEYRHQCWSVLVALKERLDDTSLTDEVDRSVVVTFTLSGVGSLGGIGGSLGGI